MRTLVLAAALVAGCYNPPPPVTAQQQADAQARAEYYRQEYARQQEIAANRTRAQQLCAETQDVQLQLKCLEWRMGEQRSEDLRRQREEADFNRAWGEKMEREARRHNSPPTCVSNAIGTTVVTNCF